ncbi:MAG TPA: hypothetical protein VGI19_14245 [Candidatus Cybelea sp.]
MKISSLFPSAVGLALAASIIAGCSSNGSSPAFTPAASVAASAHGAAITSAGRLLAMTTIAKVTPSQYAGRLKTPMMPNSVCSPWPMCLFFDAYNICGFCPGPEFDLSDAVDNAVDEYTKTPVTLTGFSEPYGECVDANGATWITNFSGQSVVKYARGGTQPIATLSTNGYSIGCSISPSGDLAVANFSSPSGTGNIQIFKNASGTPTTYENQAALYLWPPGYDNKGNLFVEAETADGVVVAELPVGEASMGVPTPQPAHIYYPGSVMWDGKYITLTDQDAGGNPSSPATTIYQIGQKGSTLTLVGSTPLLDNCNGSQVDVVQPFIAGRKNTPVNKKQGGVVIGGNLSCANRVDAWKYPAGGQPIAVAKPVPAYAYGQAVSVGKK